MRAIFVNYDLQESRLIKGTPRVFAGLILYVFPIPSFLNETLLSIQNLYIFPFYIQVLQNLHFTKSSLHFLSIEVTRIPVWVFREREHFCLSKEILNQGKIVEASEVISPDF